VAQRPQGFDPELRGCEALPANHLRASADRENDEGN